LEKKKKWNKSSAIVDKAAFCRTRHHHILDVAWLSCPSESSSNNGTPTSCFSSSSRRFRVASQMHDTTTTSTANTVDRKTNVVGRALARIKPLRGRGQSAHACRQATRWMMPS